MMRLFLLICLFASFHTLAITFSHEIDLKVAYPNATELRVNAQLEKVRDAYQGNEHIGYVIINTDFSEAIGYSGKPIHMAVGIDKSGIIQGIQMLKHSEPIILIGIPEDKLMKPFEKYIGYNVLEGYLENTLEDNQVDIVSGATVTVIVMEDSLISSILKTFRRLSLLGTENTNSETRTLKVPQPNEKQSWTQLLASGAVRNLYMNVADVTQSFAKKDYAKAAMRAESDNPSDTFIDLYFGLVSIPEIGANLLGEGEYKNLLARVEENQQAIIVAANGLFSFRGSGFVRGGVFDRFQIEQGEEVFRFRDVNYKRLRRFHAEGSPEFTEIGLFYLPAPATSQAQFDAAKTFDFSLLVNRAIGPIDKRFFNAHLPYQLPDKFVDIVKPVVSSVAILDDKDQEAQINKAESLKLLNSIWTKKKLQIVIVVLMLVVLTVIFFFQNQLVRYPRLTKVIRYSFLTFVLVWLGWMQNAQLSVVNVFTFFAALIENFDWHFFLRDPLVFILWCGVAASLILWARGAYCGWLCPFGALQELTNHIARKLKVPQITMPWGLHERLWAVKYLIFLGLLGVSMYSFEVAEHLAEVEPFKTGIILKFQRTWPFVVYALALLTIGLFIERFFCRYLCPLGAGLAIPAKLKLFEWIKRYPNDCGSPCQVCAKECMVQAIHPEGNINANECVNCLHCQIRYADEQVCPVMVKKRKKRERQSKWSGELVTQEVTVPLVKLKLENNGVK